MLETWVHGLFSSRGGLPTARKKTRCGASGGLVVRGGLNSGGSRWDSSKAAAAPVLLQLGVREK